MVRLEPDTLLVRLPGLIQAASVGSVVLTMKQCLPKGEVASPSILVRLQLSSSKVSALVLRDEFPEFQSRLGALLKAGFTALKKKERRKGKAVAPSVP